jgi:hypothetical protein
MLKIAFIGCAALLVVALYKGPSLPDATAIAPELREEPRQYAITPSALTIEKGGVTYTVESLYRYEISGLVVSKYNTDAWLGRTHKVWNDHLNVTDLCVVWGTNATGGTHHNVSFSSGEVSCSVEISNEVAWKAFDLTKVSNNHLLTDDSNLAKKLRNIRIGDQIQLTGHLVHYRHFAGNGFARGTSTVRTDTGDGACETIFVSDVKILKAGPNLWRNLSWLAGLGMLLIAAVGLAMPQRPRE